jgi:hypothetical protein
MVFSTRHHSSPFILDVDVTEPLSTINKASIQHELGVYSSTKTTLFFIDITSGHQIDTNPHQVLVAAYSIAFGACGTFRMAFTENTRWFQTVVFYFFCAEGHDMLDVYLWIARIDR